MGARSREMRKYRVPRFARRVPVAIESIAGIANAIERRTADLLATDLQVDVFPPVTLEDGDWERLCEGAHGYEFEGERASAVLLCTAHTARRIVAWAFGERERVDQFDRERELSVLEGRVLDRFVGELAGSLYAVCDAARAATQVARPRRCSVYCEIRLGAPIGASLGIAMSEPVAAAGKRLSQNAIDECPIECSVRLGVAPVDIFTIAALAIGDVLRIETKVGPSATLNLGAEVIAAGEGGVVGDRNAFKVHELI